MRTISGVDKAELHDKLAEVTVVNDSSLWVKLKEGIRSGDSIKRTYKQIRICSDPTLPPAVAPAGSKKRPAEEATAMGSSEEAKKSKGADKALAIFAQYERSLLSRCEA